MSTPHRRRHHSTDAPHVSMPLGGIGTGNLSISSDGSLRQWQLHNIGNHAGALPNSFLSLRVSRIEPPLDEIRVLQARPVTPAPTPLVTDADVPDWMIGLLDVAEPMAQCTFEAIYPAATLELSDPAVPLQITLEALNPLVPLDVATSSLPVAMFTVTIRNTDETGVHGTLGVAQQNPVGWDGVSPVDGVFGAGYGGNVNRTERRGGWISLVMDNVALPDDHPGQGQFVVAVDSADAAVLPQWRTASEWFAFLRSRALASGAGRLSLDGTPADPQRHAPSAAVGPSSPGATWNGGIGAHFDLEAGDSVTIRVLLAWTFPQRYVNFEQFGPDRPEWGSSRFWLGNHYTSVHPDARSVRDDVIARWDTLRERSLQWVDTFAESTLEPRTAEHLAAQLSLIRSPTCFRTADGRFFGFEGTLGASTAMWSGRFGGSCPLNCTHVWNYEHALARAFPELERSMRETEFDITQAPQGYIPHRVVAPVYLPQFWDQLIGGPEEPALDGMLGSVLKTYREYRGGGGADWLAAYWPNVQRLIAYIRDRWCEEDSGLLIGIQPSTHDIDLSGINSYMGTLWLAALRAGEEMALLVGETDWAAEHRALFERSSASYDTELWNGEYYQQRLRAGDDPDFQWVTGCLSDQLIGQWWAHQLDLGYLLPVDRVRTALQSVVRHNLRHDFTGFEHGYRVYADGADAGLLMCSWPLGGRPEVPTRYADEVWTGIEYQVAAHCLWEGLTDEAHAVLDALWDRYDGRRRNPYNEIECGDHYARAMAGWTVLEAMAGLRHDEPAGLLTVRSGPEAVLPIVTATGWGHLVRHADRLEIVLLGGTLTVGRMRVDDEVGAVLLTREFDGSVTLGVGERLSISLGTG